MALVAVLLGAMLAPPGCGGRDSWLREPLPDRPAVRAPAPVASDAPRVRLSTSVGDIVVALYPEWAPLAAASFLAYVDDGFYDGTIFHRVEPASRLAVIQGGGYDAQRNEKPTRAPIRGEADNGLSNVRGTIAMARAGPDPDSATSQFFLNYLDNPVLDHDPDGGPMRYGYAVFGVVLEGMDVVDRISMVPTRAEPGTAFQRLPMVDVILERARRDG